MITRTRSHVAAPAYPLERIGDPNQLLFFDIETTGFSGDTSNLYLIGCVYKEKDSWQLIQWFADTPESEPELLVAFFTFLKRFQILVHFNGDMFDIPYLLKCCRRLGLPFDFSGITSFDIYRKVRPLKNFLGLDSLKQKSIEQFLNVDREDLYNGGQLIEIYQLYLESHSDHLYDLLLLHNEDDLRGMPLILPILCYPDLFQADALLTGQTLTSQKNIFGCKEPLLSLTYEGDFRLPVAIDPSDSMAMVEAAGQRITCTVSLYEGELKFFYPNYKDYYYLPLEDKAIHKSVGEYVSPEARKKATAKTCYTRSQGLFLPQPAELWTPCFQPEYRSKQLFTPYREDLFADPGTALSYLHQILKGF